MSYDYHALCTTIDSHLQQAAVDTESRLTHWEQALQTFHTLSTHCPMTPWLWMHYAYLTEVWMRAMNSDIVEAQASRMAVLTLGIHEFPGHAVLQWNRVQLALKSHEEGDELQHVMLEALSQIGYGSHANEGFWVLDIYQQCLAQSVAQNNDAWKDLWCLRAQVPWGSSMNDTIMQDILQFTQQYNLSANAEFLDQIEQYRRQAAKQTSWHTSYQDEIDAQLHRQNLLWRPTDMSMDELDNLLAGESTTMKPSEFGMGMGDMATAQSFIQFATALRKRKATNAADQASSVTLAMAVYERGIAECPTVEALWLAYIACLQEHLPQHASTYMQVVERAVRNCPYSVALAQARLWSHYYLAQHQSIVLDPEQIFQQAQAMLNRGFLTQPTDALQVYLTAIRTVVRRVLFLASGSVLASTDTKSNDKSPQPFDAAIPATHKGSWTLPPTLSESDEQEIQDLTEDLVDMWESVHASLANAPSSLSQCRAVALQESSLIHMLVMQPIQSKYKGTGGPEGVAWKQLVKATRVHHPSHPDTYLPLIRHAMWSSDTTHVVVKLQRIRGWFQAALAAVGVSATKPSLSGKFPLREYSVALRDLCDFYLYFEEVFGSSESHKLAKRAVEKKYRSFNVVQATEKYANKREMNGNDHDEPLSKKTRTDDNTHDRIESANEAPLPLSNPPQHLETEPVSMDVTTTEPPPPPHKEFHAHPYTIRVLHLGSHVEDMDLVQTFQAKCGPIVHARIVREKHGQQRGMSKGWGLVQFEDKESVTKALALSSEMGIREQVVTIEKSHMPAVTITPPPIVPRAAPKAIHQGHDRKQPEKPTKDPHSNTEEPEQPPPPQQPKKNTSTGAAALLKPRAVARSQQKPRSRIILNEAKHPDVNND
jgi:RNA recognition motif-containing protein